MPDNTNIFKIFHALYRQEIKQHINNIPLRFIALKKDLMRYVTLTVAVLIFSLCGYAQMGAISGPSVVCAGSSIALTDTTSGGIWSSSNTAVATVGSSSGIVTAISAGETTITYTGATYVTTTITVNPLPGAISTLTAMCIGSNTPATNPTPGGIWSTTNPSIASISTSGVITGLTAGAVSVQYTMPGGCATTRPITVNATPSAITGLAAVCSLGTTSLFNSVGGGTWTSSSPGVATIGSSSGSVIAVAPGIATIYYSINSCITSTYVTVNPLPGNISGASNICVSSATSLSDPTTGGTWASSNTSVATINAATGYLSGISAGTVTISYTLPTGCRTTRLLSINPLPIGYTISSAPGSYCFGGTGVPVTLSSSQIGVNYQLYRGTSAVGAPIPGTGAPLNFGMQAVAGSYTIRATSPATGCSAVNPGSANVAVTPLPTQFNVGGGGAYCSGGTGIDVNLSGSQAGVNYQLYRGGSPTGLSIMSTGGGPLSFGLQSTAGTYTVYATNTSTGCSNHMNGSATVAINSLPSSYTVSLSDSTICAGSTGVHVKLSNTSTGNVYQLQINGVPSGTPVTGVGGALDFGIFSTSGTYMVSAVDPITSCPSMMSGAPALVVNPLPNTYSLTGGGGYCTGASGARLGLSNSETGIIYQLYNGSTPTGSTHPGLGVALDFGYLTAGTYTAIAQNPVTGCTRNMTGTVTVSANPLPAAYTVSSSGSSYCSGGAGIMISLSSSSPGVRYQLYNASVPIGIPLSGTGSPISFGYQTIAGNYTVMATNVTTSCTSNMSGSASISVTPSPVAYTVMGDGSYCNGGAGINVRLASSQIGTNYWVYQGGTVSGTSLAGTGGALDFGPRFVAGSYIIKAVSSINSCVTWMTDSAVITVNPSPLPFTTLGGGSYCTGDSGVHITISGSRTGFSYQLMNGTTSIGSALAGTGAALDFGLQTTAGTYTIVATDLLTGCTKLMNSSASVSVNTPPSIFAVIGGGSYCAGGTGLHVGLSYSNPGVTYRLYNGAALAATITGTGAPLDFGLQTTAGTYTVVATNPSGCTSNMTGVATISVTPTVTPSISINTSSGDTICSGISVNYTTTVLNEGSSPSYQWTVNGVIVGSGSSYSYTPTNGDFVRVNMTSSAACATPATVSDNVTMTVRPNPSISGSTKICIGSSTNLSGTPGGTWLSSNPSIANVTIMGTVVGVLTGMSAGVTTISYSLLGCTSVIVVTVNSLPAVTASGSPAACGGSYNIAASGGISYTWLPVTGLSCNTCAVAIARPLATTSYTVTGTAATGCSSKATVTLNGNRVSGHISYSGLPTDVFKVWLIHFNPSDSTLSGVDSTFTCMDAGAPYFEFAGKPANTYCVKAKLMGTVPGTSGYIPTYSLSTPYWYNAANAAHANATDTMHINMIYGTVPPGPGFIGGSISSGAGKGSAGTIPAQGMLVYLKDAVSNFVLTYTYTDANGHYSFSNIAEGNYVIYPEEFLYTTIPSATVMLTAGSTSANNVSFKQLTTSRRILPVAATGIASLATATDNIHIYPNPTTGNINISWAEQTTGTATLSVTNIVGQEVYNSTINISQPSGNTQVSLGNLANGVYMLTLKSADINYTWRMVVQQ